MRSEKRFNNISIKSIVKRVPFYLVTGFLGSGKTTFLKKLLYHHSTEHRIAVIQNEFAASGTDSRELELSGHEFKVVELNNGSVFCVCMMGNFASSLSKLLEEYNPDMIFLEASGLSDPINILELLQDKSIADRIRLHKIITIVDAPNIMKSLGMIQRVRHQLMIADQVLINKTDLFTGDLNKLKDDIQKINPFASLINTTHCTLSANEYLSEVASDHLAAKKFGLKTSAGRPEMKAVVLRTNESISIEGIKSFIMELQPVCPRIKGYVHLNDNRFCIIQSVFDSYEIKMADNYMGPTEIIAFSEELSPGDLRNMYKRFVL